MERGDGRGEDGERESTGKESQGVLLAFILVCVLVNVFMEICHILAKRIVRVNLSLLLLLSSPSPSVIISSIFVSVTITVSGISSRVTVIVIHYYYCYCNC